MANPVFLADRLLSQNVDDDEWKVQMQLISLGAAVSISGWSERTLWRRINDGSLRRGADDDRGRTLVSLDDVLSTTKNLQVEPEDFDLIKRADAGNADSQNDLALLLLAQGRPEGAVYWFNLAANQNHADAMNWLGRCYVEGNGVAKDENLGVMWIAKAAALGHAISEAQIGSITGNKSLARSAITRPLRA